MNQRTTKEELKLDLNKNNINCNNDSKQIREPNYPKLEENYNINNNPPQYNNSLLYYNLFLLLWCIYFL